MTDDVFLSVHAYTTKVREPQPSEDRKPEEGLHQRPNDQQRIEKPHPKRRRNEHPTLVKMTVRMEFHWNEALISVVRDESGVANWFGSRLILSSLRPRVKREDYRRSRIGRHCVRESSSRRLQKSTSQKVRSGRRHRVPRMEMGPRMGMVPATEMVTPNHRLKLKRPTPA